MLSLTEEQKAIFETAQRFALERLAPHALQWDEEHHFPVTVIKEAAALGMGGIYVSDEVGGSGLTRLDGVLIFEALAHGCPSVGAYISIHNMVAGLIHTFGNQEQKDAWLPSLCSMEHLASYCLTEPNCGSDAMALETKASRQGETYTLRGTKQFISGAGETDVYLVMARAEKGVTAFLVRQGASGLSFGANEKKMGWRAQPTRSVMLDDVRVSVSDRLGEEGQGFKIAMVGLDGGRLNIGASSLGAAQASLDKSCRYVQERRAFGGPLSSLQSVQFKLARMATHLEAARLLLYRAASSLDGKEQQATSLCAMAKWQATDVGFDVANESLQLHGGYGYLHEYGLEKTVRDLRVHQILEGTNEIMQLIISRALLKTKAGG